MELRDCGVNYYGPNPSPFPLSLSISLTRYLADHCANTLSVRWFRVCRALSGFATHRILWNYSQLWVSAAIAYSSSSIGLSSGCRPMFVCMCVVSSFVCQPDVSNIIVNISGHHGMVRNLLWVKKRLRSGAWVVTFVRFDGIICTVYLSVSNVLLLSCVFSSAVV